MATAGLYKLRLALWAGAIVSALVTGGAFLWKELSPPRPHEVQVTGVADIRNDYALTDHTGREVTEADFAGRWQLIFFGFTYCPDICPTTLAYMGSVMDELGPKAEQVTPIFITVDPARDTVPIMAAFVAAFHPRLAGLTGTEAQVAAVTRNFRVFAEKMEDADAPDGYLMAHSGYIYVMRPDGSFDAVFREAGQPSEDMASEITMRIEKEDRTR